jgi:1-deoxy-D-xylulose-5-phosphate synthase
MPKWKTPFATLQVGKGQLIRSGKDIAFITLGPIGNVALEACNQLASKNIDAALYDIRFLKPLDQELLHGIFTKFDKIFTIEDGSIIGGLGSAVTEFANDKGYHNASIFRLGIPDRFIEQGTMEELHKECGIDLAGIMKAVEKVLPELIH